MPWLMQVLVNVLLLTGFITMALCIAGQRRKWVQAMLAVVLVLVACGFALADTAISSASGRIGDDIQMLIYYLFLYNIPAILCAVFYGIYRRRAHRKRDMDKMRSQDLD